MGFRRGGMPRGNQVSNLLGFLPRDAQNRLYCSTASVKPWPDFLFSQRIALLSLLQTKSPARREPPYAIVSRDPSTVSPVHVNVASSVWSTAIPPPQSRSQSAGAGGGCQFFRAMSQRAPRLSR